MSWTFEQSSGFLINPSGVKLYPPGYAGAFGVSLNNPRLQMVKDVGPLPQGWYTIGAPRDSAKTGPYTLDLTPDPQNEMYGRGDFRIHGDSISDPGHGSDGCIVQDLANRKEVWESGDHRLEVVDVRPIVIEPDLAV